MLESLLKTAKVVPVANQVRLCARPPSPAHQL